MISHRARPTRPLQFSIALFMGVAEAVLYCAHRATIASSWGLCEQGGHLAALSRSFRACAFREQEDDQAGLACGQRAGRDCSGWIADGHERTGTREGTLCRDYCGESFRTDQWSFCRGPSQRKPRQRPLPAQCRARESRPLHRESEHAELTVRLPHSLAGC